MLDRFDCQVCVPMEPVGKDTDLSAGIIWMVRARRYDIAIRSLIKQSISAMKIFRVIFEVGIMASTSRESSYYSEC